MKRNIIVFSGEQYRKGLPPENLLKFNEWLQNKIQEIPVDYQGAAKINAITKLSSESKSYAAMEIVYQREETDTEKKKRIQREKVDEKRLRQNELTELKRLKAKYDA